jgi:hypothetical protein
MQPMKTKASTTRPMAKARSRRDSRFMPQSYTTKYFPELLTASLFKATYRRASHAWL